MYMKINGIIKNLLILCTLTLSAGAVFASQSVNVSDLTFHVFTSEDDGFFDNSVIVEGDKELLLIDAQLTRANALKVLDLIRSLKKNLKQIYITHEHADHFLGLEVFKEAFPQVEILANPKVASRIDEVYKAKLEKWHGILSSKAATREIPITRYDGDQLSIEGKKIEIHKHLQGDTDENSYLWFPKERVAVVGDMAYDQMHVYTVETTPEGRKRWIQNLDALAKQNPEIVIPGHNFPNKKLDAYSAIYFTKQYLLVFEEQLSKSNSRAEFQNRMKIKYPDAELFFSVERASAKFLNQ
ncbi:MULTISPECIES: MBL fold metallo-hydrolase [Dickeya]|uniref:Metallo-beta-lactamase superfamily protein PA0057 n=1 Tax=Dickeya aquatica TaxID=1401087 RepID=A0A375ADY3_9GAMM|nr:MULTISPECIES: MBL fold metallo-hydrolase [Dickeya]SLM64116.1 Metallo-beta-lactamase superfamily protein PA0057 [Dickeya aquatica]